MARIDFSVSVLWLKISVLLFVSIGRSFFFPHHRSAEQNMQHAKSHLAHYMPIHIAYFKSGFCVLMLICIFVRVCRPTCVLFAEWKIGWWEWRLLLKHMRQSSQPHWRWLAIGQKQQQQKKKAASFVYFSASYAQCAHSFEASQQSHAQTNTLNQGQLPAALITWLLFGKALNTNLVFGITV